MATVSDLGAGQQLTMSATENGLQFCSGNFSCGHPRPHAMHGGCYLEAQSYPDQVSGPDKEAVILRPGQIYCQTTAYRRTVWE